MSMRKALVVFCLFAGVPTAVTAQEGPGDRVYKFTVAGVNDRDTAKLLQKALMEHAGVSACTYVLECQCFKLAVNMPMDRAMLAQWIAGGGHVLEGDVQVSDGTVLGAPPEPLAPR